MGKVYIAYPGQISGKTHRYCIHEDDQGRQEKVVELLGDLYHKLGRTPAFFHVLEYISAVRGLQDPRLDVGDEVEGWTNILRHDLSDELLAKFPFEWDKEEWGTWTYTYDPKDTVTGVVMFC